MPNGIPQWKVFLLGKDLYEGDVTSADVDAGFRRAMVRLDDTVAAFTPSAQGMIWRNGQINSRASISDVECALKLIRGQASMDALGPPGEDSRSTIFNQMFISQEDSKIDEYHPQTNQNQGKTQSDIPEKSDEPKEEIQVKKPTNVDQRMLELTELIESLEI